jgi:pimeloyl-ACP methyl ester carboxylesterase
MLHDVHRRRIVLSGSSVEINVLDWGGEGPLALLHHANGFCAGVWAPLASLLRPHFRVVAMDARGHGDSSAPSGAESYRWENFGRDLAGVANALAAERPPGRVALGVGHSFGGTAFLMAAAAEPGLFERIVLLDPIIMPRAGSRAAADRRKGGGQLAEGARKRREVWPSRAAAVAKWSEKELFADWAPGVLDLYAAEGLRDRSDGQVELKCSAETEATIFESSPRFDPWALAERVAVPALIVRAGRGNFSRALYDDLAACLADGCVVEADAGHLIPMERPDLAFEIIAAFADLEVKTSRPLQVPR